jgi:endonuclease III
MQYNFRLNEQPQLDQIRARLLAVFGWQRDGARLDPVSQLILAMVSSRTLDDVGYAAFERLHERYPDWEMLVGADPTEIEDVIEPVTHHDVKARYLPLVMLKIVKRSSGPSLDFLEGWDEEPAMQWLQSLPGVGAKIAATVLNFSTLRRRVLAVDTHLLRLGARLGLLRPGADFEEGHEAFMRRVPDDWDADDLYEAHWLLKYLAQSVCTHDMAICARCPLQDICPTGAPGATPTCVLPDGLAPRGPIAEARELVDA